MTMTEARLREIYGEPGARAARKTLDRLDQHCKDFIAHSTLLMLATSDGTNLDVSPKGDPAGFVTIEDDHHLLIPDRAGNNRIDGFLNIIKHPAVGLIFVIPDVTETMRINGRAEILDDPEICAPFAIRGIPPKTVLRIEVDEAFLHCGKAFIRSGLWKPETWPKTRPIPNLNVIIRDQVRDVETPDVSDASVDKLYRDTMY
jgi:PPOX class probable FMN-dependent enzyme